MTTVIVFAVTSPIPCVCVFSPAGVVPAVRQALPLPQSSPSVPSRSPSVAGWLPVLPGVCQAARRALHWDVSLRQPEGTAVRLQRQLPWRRWGVCQWVPLLTSEQPGSCLFGGHTASVSLHEWEKQAVNVLSLLQSQTACQISRTFQLLFAGLLLTHLL